MVTKFLGVTEINVRNVSLYVNDQVPRRPLHGHPNFSNLETLVIEVYQNNRKWSFLGGYK